MLNTEEVRIETSTKCNHSCLFCPHSTTFIRKKETMEFSLFKFLLDKIRAEAPYIKHLTISGFGEAFTDPSIIHKIMYARKLGYKVHMLTNGTLLSRLEFESLVDLGISDLRISVHAINSEIWQYITGGNPKSHQRLLDNIDYFISVKDKTKLIIVCDILPKVNTNQIKPLISKYKDCADLLEIWKPHNWVNSFSFRNGSPAKKTCGRPFNSPLQVQVDGTVNMCCFDYNGELLLGDLTKQSLDEIFSSNMYTELKYAHLKGILDQTNFICKDCDQRKNQKGIVIYNSKFSEKNRIGKTSTTFSSVYKNNGNP